MKTSVIITLPTGSAKAKRLLATQLAELTSLAGTARPTTDQQITLAAVRELTATGTASPDDVVKRLHRSGLEVPAPTVSITLRHLGVDLQHRLAA